MTLVSRIILGIFVILVAAFVVRAAMAGPTSEFRGTVCTAKTIYTEPVGETRALYFRVFGNGKELDLVRSPNAFSGVLEGNGLAVSILTYARRGPVRFRVANLKFQGCSRYRIVMQTIYPERKP